MARFVTCWIFAAFFVLTLGQADEPLEKVTSADECPAADKKPLGKCLYIESNNKYCKKNPCRIPKGIPLMAKVTFEIAGPATNVNLRAYAKFPSGKQMAIPKIPKDLCKLKQFDCPINETRATLSYLAEATVPEFLPDLAFDAIFEFSTNDFKDYQFCIFFSLKLFNPKNTIEAV